MKFVSCKIVTPDLAELHINRKGDFKLVGGLSQKSYTFIGLNNEYKKGDIVLACVKSTVTIAVVVDVHEKEVPKTELVSKFYKPLLGKVNKEEVQNYFRIRQLYLEELHLEAQRQTQRAVDRAINRCAAEQLAAEESEEKNNESVSEKFTVILFVE